MARALCAKLALYKSPWFLAAVITFSGTQITNIDVRGTATQAITISLPRMSPALAALEDSYKTWGLERPNQPIASYDVQLHAGQTGAALAEKILRPQVPYEIRLQHWLSQIPMGGRITVKASPAMSPTPVRLLGMTIRRPSSELVENKPIVIAKSNYEVLPEAVHEGVPEISKARQEKLVAQLTQENWRTPTLAEKVQELIEKETGPAPTDRSVRYENGIYIAKQNATPNVVTNPTPVRPNPSISQAVGIKPPESEVGISWAKPDDGQSVRATLSGTVRLAGGLAITDANQKLVIYREWQGLAVEKAQVWLNEGRFEIVANALRGQLIGQLRDHNGQVLGEGVIKLNKLTASAASDRIDNLMLTMRPVFQGARLEVLSAHSYDQHVELVKGAKAWMMGENQELKGDDERRYFTEEGLQKGSSYVARAAAENYWGTIVVGLTGQENRAKLFPDKLMDALLNLTVGSERQTQERSGVIWGRVTRQGQTLQGARVEMAGDHKQRAHYFNSLLLPDRFAESTGENGAFAFVEVTPGIQSVRVIYQGQVWPAQIIPVELGNVSYLDFELGTSESVPLEIFDPFDPGKELNGVLRWAGDETSEIDVQGRGRLAMPSGPGLVMLEADAGEHFELMRYSVSRDAKRLELPMVRRDWLLSLASRKRVNLDAGVSMAVGFGIEEEFTVYVDRSAESTSTAEIVYFNAQGQALFSDEGTAGGGFVIFNVSPGLRTVTLVSKNEKKLFRQVILASPDAVNLILTHAQ